MRTAELYCPSCDETYKVELELDIDPDVLYCTLCGNQVEDFNITNEVFDNEEIQDEFEFWD